MSRGAQRTRRERPTSLPRRADWPSFIWVFTFIGWSFIGYNCVLSIASKLWNLCVYSSFSVPVQMLEPASLSDGLSARSTSKIAPRMQGPCCVADKTGQAKVVVPTDARNRQAAAPPHVSRGTPDVAPCHTSPPQGVCRCMYVCVYVCIYIYIYTCITIKCY